MKKLTLLTSVLAAMMLLFMTNSFAQGGTTGPLTWNFDPTTGTLMITGEGEMPDYTAPSYAPWNEYRFDIYNVIMQHEITSIGDFAFSQCRNLPSITLPNGITRIGYRAFYDCRSLLSITFPNSLTGISSNAFMLCTGLTSITIPENVTCMGGDGYCEELYANYSGGVFINCNNLKTVNYNAINCGIMYPPEPMFKDSPITTLHIGSMVQSLPEGFFTGCSSLTTIITYAVSPPLIYSFGYDSFSFKDVPKNIPVYVVCGSYDSYMNASGWGNYFTNIISGGDPNKQGICMISVNENNHNEIVWKTQEDVASYNIYREGTQSGQYDLVANITYNEQNLWVDTSSNARVRSYRYKISAINTDGCESELSDAHKTMHLTISAGQNNSWNLIWTAYEGAEYSTYNIYRSSGNSLNTMGLIGTIPSSGNTTYSDFTAPEGYVYYMVEIVLDNSCELQKSLSSIKSNIASNNPNVGIVKTDNYPSLRIYPNPVNYELRIMNYEGGEVEIYDVVGRTLMSLRTLEVEEQIIDVSQLLPGMYFIKIDGKMGRFVKE